MSEENNYENMSKQVIDLLVDQTLKKHDAKFDANKLDEKDKESIRDLVENLKQSVHDLQKRETEEEDQ